MRFFIFWISLPFVLNAEKPIVKMEPSVTQFISDYCITCHSEEKQKGNVRLDDLSTIIDNTTTAQLWQDVLDILNTGDMPPKKAKQHPSFNELSNTLQSLTSTLVKAQKALVDQGGELLVRRLNQTEYLESIKALTGVKLSKLMIPNDETSGDFDTLSHDQYFSSPLLQQYEELGKIVINEMFDRLNRKKPKYQKVVRQPEEGKIQDIAKKIMNKQDELSSAYKVYHGGEDPSKYGFQDVQAARFKYRDQHNGKLYVYYHYLSHQHIERGQLLMSGTYPKCTINMNKVDNRATYKLKVKLAAEKGLEPERSYVKITQADTLIGYYHVYGTIDEPQIIECDLQPGLDSEKLNITIQEKYHDQKSNAGIRNATVKKCAEGEDLKFIWVDSLELEGPFYKDEHFALKDLISDFQQALQSDTSTKAFIQKFCNLAFRHQIAEESYLNALMTYFQKKTQTSTKPEALKQTLAIILSSPQFLYLHEEKTNSNRSLVNAHDLASRLSMTLWRRLPDKALIHTAKQKLKGNHEVFNQKIDKMMLDPNFNRMVDALFTQWLHLKKFQGITFSIKHHPYYDIAYKDAAVKEVLAFIKTIIDEDLSLINLIDSDFIMTNSMMAQVYGIPNIDGSHFRKVSLTPNNRYRGGLLASSAILGMGSTGDRTSPVERGAFILRKMFNDPPPPPPPNVPQLDEVLKGLSVKEKLEIHNQKAQCSSCHSKMDPLGLSLENFNTIGEWTQHKNKKTQQLAIKEVTELKNQLLQQKDKMIESLIEAMIQYSLGRERGFTDEKAVAALVTVAKENDYKFKALFKAFTSSSLFLQK